MAAPVAVGTSKTSQRILSALDGKQYTPRALASELGLTTRLVRVELETMGRAGLLKTRTHRSGEVLYRKRDTVDARWDAARVSLTLN